MKILQCKTPAENQRIRSLDSNEVLLSPYTEFVIYDLESSQILTQEYNNSTYKIFNIFLHVKQELELTFDYEKGINMQVTLRGNEFGEIGCIPLTHHFRMIENSGDQQKLKFATGIYQFLHIELDGKYSHNLSANTKNTLKSISQDILHPANSNSLDAKLEYPTYVLVNKVMHCSDKENDLFLTLQKYITQLILDYLVAIGKKGEERYASPLYIADKGTVDEIAQLVESDPHIHRSMDHFKKLFHTNKLAINRGFIQYYDKSLPEFIEFECMKKAAYLLKDDSTTIDTISDALGYSGKNTFSRAFKRHFGVPPGMQRTKVK